MVPDARPCWRQARQQEDDYVAFKGTGSEQKEQEGENGHEHENELSWAVSPAPTEEAAPAAPGGTAAMPRPAPACPRRPRRAGCAAWARSPWGCALVIAGIALVAGMFRPGWDMLNLFKLTPLVLVALGAELLAASAAKG